MWGAGGRGGGEAGLFRCVGGGKHTRALLTRGHIAGPDGSTHTQETHAMDRGTSRQKTDGNPITILLSVVAKTCDWISVPPRRHRL
eukprot:273025-Prorocentrum_minimum.AAC.2